MLLQNTYIFEKIQSCLIDVLVEIIVDEVEKNYYSHW